MSRTLAPEGQLSFTAADKARDHLLASSPDTSDETLANRLADYCLAFGPPHRLFVVLKDRRAPFPLAFTRKYKNVRCFTTDDTDAARAWVIKAASLGYSVTVSRDSRAGWGIGTIAEIRERIAP